MTAEWLKMRMHPLADHHATAVQAQTTMRCPAVACGISPRVLNGTPGPCTEHSQTMTVEWLTVEMDPLADHHATAVQACAAVRY